MKGETPEETVDRYKSRTLKRVTLCFDKRTYDSIVRRLKSIGDWEGCESNSQTVEFLIEHYEENQRTYD